MGWVTNRVGDVYEMEEVGCGVIIEEASRNI